MANPNLAAFTINGTPSEDAQGLRGYDATPGETLELTLEKNPALGVLTATYELADPTKPDAPLDSLFGTDQVFVENGLKSVTLTQPNQTVSIVIDAGTEISAYMLRVTVVTAGLNGTPPGAQVFERLVVVREKTLRMTTPTESAQYAQRGWSDALNELTKYVVGLSTGGGGVPGAVPYEAWVEGGTGVAGQLLMTIPVDAAFPGGGVLAIGDTVSFDLELMMFDPEGVATVHERRYVFSVGRVVDVCSGDTLEIYGAGHIFRSIGSVTIADDLQPYVDKYDFNFSTTDPSVIPAPWIGGVITSNGPLTDQPAIEIVYDTVLAEIRIITANFTFGTEESIYLAAYPRFRMNRVTKTLTKFSRTPAPSTEVFP